MSRLGKRPGGKQGSTPGPPLPWQTFTTRQPKGSVPSKTEIKGGPFIFKHRCPRSGLKLGYFYTRGFLLCHSVPRIPRCSSYTKVFLSYHSVHFYTIVFLLCHGFILCHRIPLIPQRSSYTIASVLYHMAPLIQQVPLIP